MQGPEHDRRDPGGGAAAGWKHVGVLGLGDPVVYTRPLGQLGIASETVDAGPRAALDQAIFRLMEGRDDADSADAARGRSRPCGPGASRG